MTPQEWAAIKRIAVIGDSISTRANGASATTWPSLLASMMQDGGMDVTFKNYSLPGLRWKTAHVPTGQWLIGNELCPVDALKRDGCDLLIVTMGVNDRQNPNALADALAFKAALPDVPTVYVQQVMYDERFPDATVATKEEHDRMLEVYAALGFIGPAGANFAKLYDCGLTYDKLHPTDTGKQWIASAVYMWFQQHMPLTKIARNIALLWELKQDNPIAYKQMLDVTR